MNESIENMASVDAIDGQVDYTLKAFRATDNKVASNAFFEGHLAVLLDYGIINLNTSRPSWLADPNVWVINVYDKDDIVVGGLRVHRYLGGRDLPLIDALIEVEPKIVETFESTLPKGTAEVCGLWSSKRVFGKGLSPVACMSSVAIVKQLGLDNFFCFSAPYTEKMISANGCIPVLSLGNEGRFNYPTPEFVSVVLYNPSISELAHASSYNANRIRSLIEQPNQYYMEPSPRGAVKIRFELELNHF